MIWWMLAVWSLVPLCLSKTSLHIWMFMVHVLLKPGLENFEHYFTSMWDECNCAVVWTFFGIAFLWHQNENWSFPALWPLLSFPNLLAYWVQHFHSITFRIWNSSVEIPSPPLALFVVMLSKAHLTSQDVWLSVNDHIIVVIWVMKVFFVQFCVFSPALLWYLVFLLGPYCFCPLLCPSLHEMFPWYL